jgi:hypothetical protein
LHKIAATSEHAVEHYRVLMSQIRMLGIMTDREKFEHVAVQNSRLTPEELALWRQIQNHESSSASS